MTRPEPDPRTVEARRTADEVLLALEGRRRAAHGDFVQVVLELQARYEREQALRKAGQT